MLDFIARMFEEGGQEIMSAITFVLFLSLIIIIGLMTTCPFTAIGLSNILCMPSIALCGMLMIGVLIIQPDRTLARPRMCAHTRNGNDRQLSRCSFETISIPKPERPL